MAQTSFTDRSNYFGSNDQLKRKISRPRTDTDEVHRLERGLCAMERIYVHSETGAKRLPQQVILSKDQERVVRVESIKCS